PAKAVEQLQAQFDQAEQLTEAQVTTAINNMKELLGSVTDTGRPNMPDGGARYGNVDDGHQLIEALFNDDDHNVTSIRQVYLDCTGDRHFTGRIIDCSRTRMAEALDSTSFPDALGEFFHKRLLELYKQATIYDVWGPLVDIVSANDFRDQTRVMIGGYGDLAAVAESGAYPALASPGDAKERYRVSKKGGTEKITLEMIANDDIGAIKKIPGKMNMAAKRTLSKFVFSMVTSNPVMGDGKAWFHTDHANLATTAFSGAAYAAARLAMMRQVEPGSDAELGLMPRNLWVPPELEETAADTFKRDTNLDATFVQSLKPQIIPVWCWQDPNDWLVTCDSAEQTI
ncbi:hypothetical protein, partial [Bowmanella denitrificans]|uniref:phage major capsid protein n=1 Tax=Bowmanella denitrificans TaxID=366582 RepID=UPI001C0E92ED